MWPPFKMTCEQWLPLMLLKMWTLEVLTYRLVVRVWCLLDLDWSDPNLYYLTLFRCFTHTSSSDNSLRYSQDNTCACLDKYTYTHKAKSNSLEQDGVRGNTHLLSPGLLRALWWVSDAKEPKPWESNSPTSSNFYLRVNSVCDARARLCEYEKKRCKAEVPKISQKWLRNLIKGFQRCRSVCERWAMIQLSPACAVMGDIWPQLHNSDWWNT